MPDIKVQNGALVAPNEAMYLFAKDDVGGSWRESTVTENGKPADRRQGDNGYVWPDTMNICLPTGHGDPNVMGVDFFVTTPRDCVRGTYILINRHYRVEFQFELR